MKRDARTVSGWEFDKIIPCHGVSVLHSHVFCKEILIPYSEIGRNWNRWKESMARSLWMVFAMNHGRSFCEDSPNLVWVLGLFHCFDLSIFQSTFNDNSANTVICFRPGLSESLIDMFEARDTPFVTLLLPSVRCRTSPSHLAFISM